MHSPSPTDVLIATLGSEPQIVAIATQLLLAEGRNLREIFVLHTYPHLDPIASALKELGQTFLVVDWESAR